MGAMLPLFFILLIFSVTATDWTTYAKDNSNNALQNTSFIGGFDLLGSHTYNSVAFGTDYQPLIADFDADGTNEIAIHHGNLIKFYTLSLTNTLTLENEFNLGASVGSQPTSINVDSDSRIELIFALSTSMYTADYDGTNLNLTLNGTIGSVIAETGISCVNDTVVKCYMGTTAGMIVEYNASTAAHQNSTVLQATASFSNLDYGLQISPVIEDINNDGELEIILPYDDSGDVQDEGLIVVNQEDLTLDTSFSTDGKIPNLGAGTNDAKISGVLTHDFDGGMTETCLTLSEISLGASSTEHARIICYNGLGTEIVNVQVRSDSTVDDTSISNPVITNVLGSGDNHVCALAAQSNNLRIACYDETGTVVADSRTVDNTGSKYVTASVTTERYTMTSANIGTDESNDLIIGNAVFGGAADLSLRIFNLTTPTATNVQSNSVTADLNGDNQLEIIGLYTSYLYVATSDFTNQPPTLTATFGRTWLNPVCNGSTIKFSAVEYDEADTRPTGTNYYNDIDLDQERLRANCNGTANIVNGSYSQANPTVSCTYTVPGTYEVDIYIEDASNPGDLTQLDTEIVQVTLGTEGVTCDTTQGSVGGTTLDSDTTVVTATGVSTGLTDSLDFITGGDSDSKLLIGFILLMVILVGVGVLAKNMIMGFVAGIVGIIIVTALGLFPAWILVVFIILVVFLGIAMLATGMSGGGE